MTAVPTNGAASTPEALEARARRRMRRRFGAWAAFLLVGLTFGVIYATGFATTGGANSGSSTNATANTNTPAANADTSALAGLITQPASDITYTWAGRWGDLASAALYKINLDGEDGGDNFFAEVVLTNTPAGFSDLQIQLRIADVGIGGTCNAAAIDGATTASDHRVMTFDHDDAQVTFSGMTGGTGGLPGGSTYCIGVSDYGPNPTSGKDTGGTFIRKSTTGTTPPGTYPEFVGTLNRMP